MALTRRPAMDSSKADAFMSGAPDAKGQSAVAPAAAAPAPTPGKPARVIASSARKHPISLTIDATILARMDDAAAARGLSRAAAIADACADWLKSKEGA